MDPAPVYFPDNDLSETVLSCITLPCLQTQGTVTAVQLQTEAPVVTASGQQVQTLQVVVSPPPPCVTVTTMLQPTSLHATTRAVYFFPCPISVLFGSSSLPSMSSSCLNCMFLSTVCCVSASVSACALMTTVCLSCVCFLLLKASYVSQMFFSSQ